MSRKIEVNWERIFEEYSESGKTQRQFCKENNLVRSGIFAKNFLNGFKGYLHTDGWVFNIIFYYLSL